ncbi:MAG: SDR family oxidoreductase [Bacteroidota bacterium]
MTDRRSFLSRAALGAAGASLAATPAALATTTSTTGAAALSTDRPLDGRAAVVTGARNNIGRAIAVELARMGADVVVHYHRPETRDQAEETARMCQAHGVRTALAVGDLGRLDTNRRMFDTATDTFGRLDVFVHNAGRLELIPIAEVSDEAYLRMQRVNVDATFYGFREAAQRIEDGGRILGISSAVTAGPIPSFGVYTSGKMFMEGMVLTLAKELGSRRITVNAIAPGAFNTPFFHALMTPESVIEATPMGRLGEVEELIPLVRMLVSPEAGWMNGETIYVNNGVVQA